MEEDLFNYFEDNWLDDYWSEVSKVRGFVYIFNEEHESSTLKVLWEVRKSIKEAMDK